MFKKKRPHDRSMRKKPSHARRLHEGRPCITISCQWGSKGESVPQLLSQRLGFEVYGSRILDILSEQSMASRDVLAALDEDSTTEFNFLMSSLLGGPYVVAEDFARDLVRVIHQLADEGHCIIVGRGAAFVLHGPRVLNVRIIEPFEERLRRVQDVYGMSYTEAEITLAERDSARSQFVEGHFKRDIEDLEAYDMVLNAHYLDEETLAEVILRAFEAKRRPA